ncbi:hypothetical protein C8Q75DRAFT_765355 [Abortiporus biennis]|nr:hypothetical protein C8Q75DRAFT_765355 [Abortiporus biennis]
MSTTDSVTSQWLEEKLAELLASPHISFASHKSGLPGIRLGPGPIDLFSTRFNNLVTHDVTGSVAGKHVDKAGLKEGLLALQKKWNPDTASFNASTASEPHAIATSFAWTQRESTDKHQVSASASVREEGGAPRCFSLTLEGEPSLFRVSA